MAAKFVPPYVVGVGEGVGADVGAGEEVGLGVGVGVGAGVGVRTGVGVGTGVGVEVRVGVIVDVGVGVGNAVGDGIGICVGVGDGVEVDERLMLPKDEITSSVAFDAFTSYAIHEKNVVRQRHIASTCFLFIHFGVVYRKRQYKLHVLKNELFCRLTNIQ